MTPGLWNFVMPTPITHTFLSSFMSRFSLIGLASEAHAFGDDDLHDLRRAGEDRLDTRVAVGAAHGVFLHVAVAAVELQAEVDVALAHLGHPPLRHARFLDDGRAFDVLGDQAVDEDPAELDLGRDLDELELGVLELTERFSERGALLRVLYRLLEDDLRRRLGADRAHQALLLQLLHEIVEAAAFASEEVLRGHAAVGEMQLGRVLRMHPHLVELATFLESGCPVLDDEEAHAAVRRLRIGLRRDDHQVAEDAVGDERLLAVHDVVTIVTDCGRLDRGEIGAGVGLGHGDRRDELAADATGNPARLLLVGAVAVDVRHTDVAVQGEREARGAGADDLLVDDRRVREVDAGAAVLRIDLRAEEALLPGPPPGVAVDDALLLPALDVRRHLARAELLELLTEELVLGSEYRAFHADLLDACT